MRKIVLILLSLVFFDGVYSNAQVIDSIVFDKANYKKSVKWNSMRQYIGVMPGFQVYRSDSAQVTVAIPVGINIRRYSQQATYKFYDADIAITPIILNQNELTSFLKLCVGMGTTRGPYSMQLHVNYAFSFYDNSDWFGGGYDIEAQSIPISIDFFLPSEINSI